MGHAKACSAQRKSRSNPGRRDLHLSASPNARSARPIRLGLRPATFPYREGGSWAYRAETSSTSIRTPSQLLEAQMALLVAEPGVERCASVRWRFEVSSRKAAPRFLAPNASAASNHRGPCPRPEIAAHLEPSTFTRVDPARDAGDRADLERPDDGALLLGRRRARCPGSPRSRERRPRRPAASRRTQTCRARRTASSAWSPAMAATSSAAPAVS